MKTSEGTRGERRQRRRRLAESEAIRKFQEERRFGGIKIQGVGAGKLVTIQPKDFDRLGIDERYQRVRIAAFVNDLIHAIKGGGAIVDPISVAERKDGSWWIVDGQQRFWASYECQVPLKAMIYPVESFEAEKNLFLAMNRTVKLGPNFIVHAWPGATGVLLRKWHDDLGPVRGLINFGHDKKEPFGAAILARGLCGAVTGINATTGKRLEWLLARCDAVLEKDRLARERADAYIRLIVAIFAKAPRLRFLIAIGFGRVCYRRWENGVHMKFPNRQTLGYFRRVNWDTLVPSTASKFLPMVESHIEQRWKD